MTVTEAIPSLDLSRISFGKEKMHKASASIATSQFHESLTERLNLPPPYEENKLMAQTMYMPSIPVKKPSNKDSDRKRFLRVQNNMR